MTHLHPGRGGIAAPPAMRSVPQPGPALDVPIWTGFDRGQIADRIAERRMTLAGLEVALVAACEMIAGQHRAGDVRIDDRASWDRAMWQRYLDAATQLEPDYSPRMLALLREIDRLERLLALPITRERVAA